MSADDPMGHLRRSVPDDHRMDGSAADRIEAALRIAHADRHSAPLVWWRRPALFGALGLLVLIAAAGTLVIRDTTPSAALVVTDASGVTIRLPDGSEIVDPSDGFALPDGAVVSIADGGMVTIDDTIIDAASVLVVRDGSLASRVAVTVPDDRARPDRVPTTSAAPEREASPSTSAPERSEPTSTTTTVDSGSDPADDGRGDDGRRAESDDDEVVRTTSSTVPPPTTAAPVEARPADPPVTETIEISLDLEARNGAIVVSWSVRDFADGWQVVIRRRIGDGPIVDVTGPTRAASGEVVDVLDGGDGPVAYQLVILDGDGSVIAESPRQSLRR